MLMWFYHNAGFTLHPARFRRCTCFGERRTFFAQPDAGQISPINKCEALGNTRVVNPAGLTDALQRNSAKCRATNQRSEMMKKIILLAITMAFAVVGTASAGDAKETWEKSCAKCHGVDGKGQTKMGQKLGVRDYTDAKVQAELKDDVALKAIKEGLKDKDDKTLMKPAEGLSDDEIKALVAYVRTFKK